MSIARGEVVRVKGIDGLMLDVDADAQAAAVPKQASAIDE